MSNRVLLAIVAFGLAAGASSWAVGWLTLADTLWGTCVVPVLASLVIAIFRDIVRGRIGVDVIAALAMAGALLLSQPLAGAVIAAMYAGGITLEDFAVARAERELSALAQRAPRVAHLRRGESVVDVAVADVAPGDRLSVRGGEVIAVDGIAADSVVVVDESALTGEPVPVTRRTGEPLTSGTVNAGETFEMIATATASASTYAHIVELAKAAHASKAGFVRLADRYALWFLPATLLVAGAAWLLSGDAVRALAVLVVATPCPLILATPVAFVSGISYAARRGILIKGAAALEALASAEVLLLDKTGTLTVGGARVTNIECAAGWNDAAVLQLVASLEQASAHVVARALVQCAQDRGLSLSIPTEVREEKGAGIEGTVCDRCVKAGSLDFVFGRGCAAAWVRAAARRAAWRCALSVFVTVDGEIAGAISLSDEIRVEAPRAIRALRSTGISRIVMLTGDRTDSAETIAAALDVDAVLAERVPEDKTDAVREEQKRANTVMVGDGINDAPALAAAHVGIAMGARGASASSEAADVVILVDRLDRVAEALAIARRTRRIAVQSAASGMGLSLIAMAFAAIGALPPVAGALLQEGIDVLAILYALRALLPPSGRTGRRMGDAMADELQREHRVLANHLDTLRDIGSRLSDASPPERVGMIRHADCVVQQYIVPHERQDDRTVYPELDRLIGDRYTSSAMGRAHREILHLSRLLSRMATDATPDSADDLFVHDAHRALLSLEAIVRLHSAQEDDVYDSLSNA